MTRLLASLFLLVLLASSAQAAGCAGTGNCYWIGGSGNINDTAHWATSDGGVTTGGLPTSADNCNFTALSNTTAYTVSTVADSSCLNVTFAAPSVSGTVTFGDGTHTLNFFGDVTLLSGMVFNTSMSAARASGTSTFTSNGVVPTANITSGNAGGITFADAFHITGTITVNQGTFTSNAKTITCNAFTSTSGTRTVNLTNSTVNITGTSGTPWNINTTGTLTFTATGSTINYSGGAAGVGTSFLANGGFTFGSVNITAAGPITFTTSASTFTNLSYTSTTNKTDQLILNGNSGAIAAGGSLTIAGNSSVNRAFLVSSVLGTQRNISVPSGATVTVTNTDFQDVNMTGTFSTGATASSIGDALGNTFGWSSVQPDVSATQTLTGTGSINWSTAANWTSRVPLPQDDVSLGSSSTATTLTADMPRLGRNIDASNFTKSLQLGSQTAVFFGNLSLSSAMTFGGGQTVQAQGRGLQTITSNTKSTPSTFQISAFGGTYTLQDNYTATSLISINAGTFDSQGLNVSVPSITLQATIKATSASIWSLSNTSGTPWNANGSADTTNFFATIKFTGAITSATFAGAGKTYNTLYWSNTASTGTLIVTGANTFNGFQVDGTTARTVQFPASTVNTVNTLTRSGGNAVITLNSSSAGTAATLRSMGRRQSLDFLSIKDIDAVGGAGWFAGDHSTNTSNNVGWQFHAPGEVKTILRRRSSALEPGNDNQPLRRVA